MDTSDGQTPTIVSHLQPSVQAVSASATVLTTLNTEQGPFGASEVGCGMSGMRERTLSTQSLSFVPQSVFGYQQQAQNQHQRPQSSQQQHHQTGIQQLGAVAGPQTGLLELLGLRQQAALSAVTAHQQQQHQQQQRATNDLALTLALLSTANQLQHQQQPQLPTPDTTITGQLLQQLQQLQGHQPAVGSAGGEFLTPTTPSYFKPNPFNLPSGQPQLQGVNLQSPPDSLTRVEGEGYLATLVFNTHSHRLGFRHLLLTAAADSTAK